MQINRLRFRGVSFAILMSVATYALPQQEKAPAETASLPKTISSDIGRVISSPLHLSKREGLQLAAFTAISAGLYTFLDDPIDEEYAREGHHSLFWPAKEMAEIGKLYDDIKPVYFAAGLSAGMFVSGLALQDKKLLETTRLMVEAIVLAEAITYAGKIAAGRSRPANDRGPHDLNFLNRASARNSNPCPQATPAVFLRSPPSSANSTTIGG